MESTDIHLSITDITTKFIKNKPLFNQKSRGLTKKKRRDVVDYFIALVRITVAKTHLEISPKTSATMEMLLVWFSAY